MNMRATSWIELSRDRYARNVRYLKKRIGTGATFCSVIKGNAYGHGIEQMVRMAQDEGVDWFAVYDAEEAFRVYQVAQADTNIMIMGMVDHEAVEWAVEHGVSFYVFDPDRLAEALETAKQIGCPARIHLELETGLNRTGLDPADLNRVAEMVLGSPEEVHIEGVCTHFAGAESIANHIRVTGQMERFHQLVSGLQKVGVKAGRRHTACSAAALTFPKAAMDMVRFGIAQYGFWPSKETRMHNLLTRETQFKRDPLRRVLSWKSSVMGLKQVAVGNFVSYGTSYQTLRDEILAIVPVGYAHGFSRSLSNRGHVLIRGRRAPVVGMVNMNMIMVDVTDIPQVAPGDEVVLIGKQGRREITVSAFTDLTQNVNYEMLTRLPAEIPRHIVK